MHEGELRERNGYERWLGVNMCMGMRMGLHGNENGLAWTWMGLHGWEFRERNGYEGWLGVNMCMGMRMGLHGWERVCMDENLEIETGMRDGWMY